MNWPKLALFFAPLCIVAVDAAVLITEYLQPDAVKAIRMVRESESRKENFTVQQYLYTTIYHQRKTDSSVTIGDWRAEQSSNPAWPLTVKISFADRSGQHEAVWAVNVKTKSITPVNEVASELSWH